VLFRVISSIACYAPRKAILEITRNNTNEVPVSTLSGILKFLSKAGTRPYSPVG
jgi:hypothetical protein